MAYQVVKTIKGKQYLYLQSTYREGKKVKTISHYVGAINSETGVLTEPSDDADHPRPHNTAEQIEQVLAQGFDPLHPQETIEKVRQVLKKKKQPKIFRRVLNVEEKKPKIEQSQPKTEKKPVTDKPNPVITFSLKANCKISLSALEKEHQKHLNFLKKHDIDPTKFPPVTVKHGKKYSHHKPAFKWGLVITAPKEKFNREKLRTEYRKALHRAFIDTMEHEAPEKMYAFQYTFDKSYQQTQDALTKYLFNTNSKDRFYKVLALKFFHVINPIPTGKHAKLAPEKIGLVEYGQRESWKDEYASIMTAIDKHGIKTLSDNAHNEIAKANKGQRETIKKKTIFFMRKRKTIKRLQARIEANQELIKKLNLIRKYQLHLK